MSIHGSIHECHFLSVSSEDEFAVGHNDSIIEPFSGLESCHCSSVQGNSVDLGDLSL